MKSKPKLVPVLLGWFAHNARDLPWRRTRDPYAIWVSEIMLQQTQVKTVVPYWQRWMRELPDIAALAQARSERIHKLWEGLGYYTRVRNLQKAARMIVGQHGGRFPRNFADVLALPGIGRYTAGAICSIAFNQPKPVLDGNVVRVLTRVFGILENPRDRKTNVWLWQLAEELVLHASRITHHASSCSHFNQSLMELGALVCTPRAPKCEACPVSGLCTAFRENRQAELPNFNPRAAATARHFIAFIVERGGRFLVRQRPAGVVNAHLWEFPNVEFGAQSSRTARAAARSLGLQLTTATPFCTLKHSITRYRITLKAFQARLGRTSYTSPKHNGAWLSPKQLAKLPFTAAHKKILAGLIGSTTLDLTRTKSCELPR